VYNLTQDHFNLAYQLGFDLNSESAEGKRIKNHRESIADYAAFLSVQWDVTDKLKVQPAVRGAYNTKYKAPLTPSLNIKYNFKKVNLRLSYAKGFRAPSLKELYLDFVDTNHKLKGNEDLKAEESHNINFSANYKNMWSEIPVDINLNSFYNHIYDMIDYIQVDPNDPIHFQNENISEFESIGGSFAVESKFLSRLKLGAGIATTGSKNYDLQTDYIFSTDFNFTYNYHFLKRTANLTILYTYKGERPQYSIAGLSTINAYHNMDISVSKYFFNKKLSIASGVKNLFDNTNVGSSSNGTSVHGGRGGSLVAWGRTFFVSVKYSFSKY
jgi:outer membrane receptor for ferrienterochelin and colicins